jgi:hypothetical protein
MDIMQAIEKRISCRAYDDRAVEADKLDQLAACIEEGNAAGGLRMVLVRPEDGGANLKLSGAMFSGRPSTYIALIAADDEETRDRLGYYGEKVVLLAEQLGLGTCWVAGTYDQSTVAVARQDGEKLHGVIPVGYAMAKMPLKQRTVRAALRKRDRKPADVYAEYASAPAWIRAGVDAMIKGPSAVNGQPWVLVDTPSGVAATLPRIKSTVEYIDLGIAKLHFQLGALNEGVEGSWTWGAGGVFTTE